MCVPLPGLPIPSCGWRTGPQLGPDTDLAIASGNNKPDQGPGVFDLLPITIAPDSYWLK